MRSIVAAVIAWVVACGIAIASGPEKAPGSLSSYNGRVPYRRASGIVALEIGGRIDCSGVLLATDVVVTAGHCVSQRALSAITVVAQHKGEVSTSKLLAVKLHPAFDYASLSNDLAVLKLERALSPRPVMLAQHDKQLTVGVRVTLVGFGGRIAAGARTGGHMIITKLDTAVFVAEPAPATACGVDSGGAALDHAGRLIGVVSRGDYRCRRETVFSWLAHHRRFLLDALR